MRVRRKSDPGSQRAEARNPAPLRCPDQACGPDLTVELVRIRRNLAMCLDPALQSAMLAAVPEMGAFALGLCHQRDRADDFVQEALLRAITNIQLFKGGNLTAWLFTILRNNFLNEYRRSRHEVADTEGYLVG